MTCKNYSTIFGTRLKQARKMCGFSLRDLEQSIGGAVSYNALNKYEKGQMMPSGDVLVSICQATGQSYGFFFRPLKNEISQIRFRKKAKLSKKTEDSIRENALDFFERYNEIEDILGVERIFKNPLGKRKIKSPKDAESAAEDIRSSWNLGTNALPNIHEILENNSVKVYEAESNDDFDGFSGWLEQDPIVVISKRLNEQCLTRKRSTFAHELGHIILKDNLEETISAKDEERIVHRFASALLLPMDSFLAEFGKHRNSLSLEELIDVKISYGISIAAIVYRAHDLGCINDALYERFWRHYNKRGWRNCEPGDDEYQGNESSTRFKQLVWRAVAEEEITRSKGAEILNMPLTAFRDSFEVFQ